MLNIKKLIHVFQNCLIVVSIIATGSMFYVKYKMFSISEDLIALDKKIEKLQKDKELLNIELTYLTSTERFLSMIDKNPEILNEKDVIESSQLKTRKEFVASSLTKLQNQVYSDNKVAKK